MLPLSQEQYMQQLMASAKPCQSTADQQLIKSVTEKNWTLFWQHLDNANIDCVFEGYTPLVTAVINQNVEMARQLLLKKANPNLIAPEIKRTALMSVQGENAATMADVLLKADALVDLIDYKGNTALIYAVGQLQLEVATKLLDAGASVHIHNHQGLSAFDILREKAQQFGLKRKTQAKPSQSDIQLSSKLIKLGELMKTAYQRQGLKPPN